MAPNENAAQAGKRPLAHNIEGDSKTCSLIMASTVTCEHNSHGILRTRSD
jgi:hypothetical protein